MLNSTPFPVSLSSSFCSLIVLTLAWTVLFHLSILFYRPSKFALKLVDYTWLILGSLAFFKVSTDTRVSWAVETLPNVEREMVRQYNLLTEYIHGDGLSFLELKYESSPQLEVDTEATRQNSEVLKWVLAVREQAPKTNVLPQRKIKSEELPTLTRVTRPQLLDTIEHIRKLISDFESTLSYYQELQEDTKSDSSDILIRSIFGPILLCFAIGLRLAKVTCEIWGERGSSSNGLLVNTRFTTNIMLDDELQCIAVAYSEVGYSSSSTND